MSESAAPTEPPEPSDRASRLARWLSSRKGLVVLYLVFLGAYLGASGERLRRPSPYNHFAYQAHSWLHGSLALIKPPPNENDWALVEELHLRDGTTVRGQFSKRGNVDRFLPLRGPGRTIPPDQIVSRRAIRYVSFPPLPAVLMLPVVAIAGVGANDVVFTVLWAAVNPVLLFLLLGSLRARGHSRRTPGDDLWLTVLFGVGSVYYFASVIGQVWYTAHVIGVTCVIGYAFASLDARRPALAGLCLGLGFATRTPLGFMFPFFLLEAARAHGGWRALWRARRLPRPLVGQLARFAAPATVVLTALLVHNHLRFASPLEFGHSYLNILWQGRIQQWGLFNYHFLSRNLAVALVLLPRVLSSAPYVQVSRHGMSLLVTSPALGWLVRAPARGAICPALWWTVLAVALPSLLYQNSGFVQFGYRFSLDYMVFLVMLLAAGGARFGRVFKLAILVAIPVNLFGAVTFDRLLDYMYADSFFPHGAE